MSGEHLRGELSFAIHAANSHRLALSGEVWNQFDNATVGDATVSLAMPYSPPHRPSVRCSPTFTSPVDAEASYRLDLSIPSYVDLTSAYNVTYTASGYAPVERAVRLLIPSESCPSEDAPTQWLDPVSLLPDTGAASTLRGRAYSVRTEYNYLLDLPTMAGAFTVTLHLGIDATSSAPVLRTNTTGVGGGFEFSDVPPGMYTLRAVRTASVWAAVAPLNAVAHSINVKSSEQAAALGMLILSEVNAQTQAFVVLRYSKAPLEADLSLHLTFASSQPTSAPSGARCPASPEAVCAGPYEPCYYEPACTGAVTDRYGGLGCNAGGLSECRFCGFGVYPPCPVARCEVWRGRRYCGSSAWQQASLPCTAVAAPTCAGPSQLCYFDPQCGSNPYLPGCYAGGHATCRSCGGSPFLPPCPASNENAVREAAQVIAVPAPAGYTVTLPLPPSLYGHSTVTLRSHCRYHTVPMPFLCRFR